MDSPRFTDALPTPSAAPAGFVLMPVLASQPEAASPMQWLYQHLYDRAQRAQEPPRARELFTVMN